MWLGISAGKHSTSTSRSICSIMPPSCFTPAASPTRKIGTLTVSTLSRAIRFRSMCSSRPLIGSYCQSTIMALVFSPSMVRSKIVLWPVSEFRIRVTTRGSTLIESESFPAPYTTAGIFPSRRTRLASFLVPACLGCASSTFVSNAVAINVNSYLKSIVILRRQVLVAEGSGRAARIATFCAAKKSRVWRASLLHKQLTDRCFLVIGLNRPANQSRNREDRNLSSLFRSRCVSRRAERDRVRDHYFFNHRGPDVLDRRARQYCVGRASVDIRGAVLLQSQRRLHQRAAVSIRSSMIRHVRSRTS